MKVLTPSDPAPEGVEPNPPQRTGQLLRFRGITKRDIDPGEVVDGARANDLKAVVILGYDSSGAEYFASSMADGADVLWLLERLKQKLLAATFADPVEL